MFPPWETATVLKIRRYGLTLFCTWAAVACQLLARADFHLHLGRHRRSNLLPRKCKLLFECHLPNKPFPCRTQFHSRRSECSASIPKRADRLPRAFRQSAQDFPPMPKRPDWSSLPARKGRRPPGCCTEGRGSTSGLSTTGQVPRGWDLGWSRDENDDG
jgi:hypothetical protein